jgi:ribonucleoside-diphosphate reductase beta chain
MRYPQAYDFYSTHETLHWLKDEIPLAKDVQDWKSKRISDGDRTLLNNYLRIFTQSDVMVFGGYVTMMRAFKPTEVRMMHSGFLAREAIHTDAYSYFTDTIGMNDAFYEEWKEIEEAEKKMTFIENAKVKTLNEYTKALREEHPYYTEKDIYEQADYNFRTDLAKMLAIYGGLVEGVSLFSSFAILFNYSRNGLMNGLSTIVSWSLRDEDLHSRANAWLFRTLISENPDIWTDTLKRDIYSAAREVVDLEDRFIEYAFGTTEVKGIKKDDLKNYVRFMADRRLLELGMKANWGIKENPLPWMDTVLNSSLSNFFDVRVTEYGKGATKGDWGDVRTHMRSVLGKGENA